MDEELYKQNIIEHSKAPKNRGVLEDFDIKEDAHNPSCGDNLTLSVKIKDDTISDVAFLGDGCAISTASASMFTEYIKGKKIDELQMITPGFIYDMLGIKISPSRSRCALLVYDAFENILKKID